MWTMKSDLLSVYEYSAATINKLKYTRIVVAFARSFDIV